MSTRDALVLCPELVLVPGEDLTPYRAASASILSILERYGPAERLGMDEVWVDATEQVWSRIQGGAGAIGCGGAGATAAWVAASAAAAAATATAGIAVAGGGSGAGGGGGAAAAGVSLGACQGTAWAGHVHCCADVALCADTR